jgi:enoyl-CoA hydratase
MTDHSAVRWADAAPGILVVTMAHGRANALGPPILDGLTAALDQADRRTDVRTLVLASALPGFFAAGADIKHMSTVDGPSFAAYGDRLRGVLDRIADPRRVAIAAVEGLALGGGLELAMAAHLRVAGADAKFGLPEVKLGLIPGAGGTQRLPRLVGRGRAIDIMATGRQVPADEAKAIGLVDRLVEPGQAHAAAVGLAGELGAVSGPALSAVLRTVDAAFDLPLDAGLRYEVAQVQGLFEHGEVKEGLTAFLERRPPNFD